MKAEIFCLENDKDTAVMITQSLKRHVYPSIKPNLRMIDTSRQAPQIAWRYIKLLQASIPPDKGIELGITELEHFGYQFYIKVFYAFKYSRTLRGSKGLHNFFPALAIRDRMVLVPKGLGILLEDEVKILSPFKALEAGGQTEVDFNDRRSLDLIMAQISQKVHTDFLQELQAYTSHTDFQQINFDQIAHDMDVDSEFLEYVLEKAKVNISSLYSQIDCAIQPKKILFGRWTKANLTIINKSKVDIEDIAVKISGPVKVLPGDIRDTVLAQSHHDIKISIMPEAKGEFPIEIAFILPKDNLLVGSLPMNHVWLQCE